MSDNNQHLDSIEDIRQMMQKSSRFISLSGLSGVAAGVCALIASWMAYDILKPYRSGSQVNYNEIENTSNAPGLDYSRLDLTLLYLAAGTFVAAFALAFLFTWLRSRKTGISLWGFAARRVMINVAVPMLIGACMILRLIQLDAYELIPPACLIFYGLGLVNASKFALPEIRYMGYGQLILGGLNLLPSMAGYGLFFWAIGFGLLHIIYGIVMWNKYERTT
jgi:hypothetical protein